MTPVAVDPRIERTHQVVLAAAVELLADQGFERVTIDGLAERSGVARSTIYRNWPDRAQLLAEAFAAMCPVHGAVDLGSLEADLRAVGTGLAQGLAREGWGLALPSLIAAADHDPDLRTAYVTFTGGRRAALRETLARAQERGEVGRHVDLDQAATRFAAPFFYARLISREPLDDAFVEAQVADAVATMAPIRDDP